MGHLFEESTCSIASNDIQAAESEQNRTGNIAIRLGRQTDNKREGLGYYYIERPKLMDACWPSMHPSTDVWVIIFTSAFALCNALSWCLSSTQLNLHSRVPAASIIFDGSTFRPVGTLHYSGKWQESYVAYRWKEPRSNSPSDARLRNCLQNLQETVNNR